MNPATPFRRTSVALAGVLCSILVLIASGARALEPPCRGVLDGALSAFADAAALPLPPEARLEIVDRMAASRERPGLFGAPLFVKALDEGNPIAGGRFIAAAFRAGPEFSSDCMADKPDLAVRLFYFSENRLSELGVFHHIVDRWFDEDEPTPGSGDIGPRIEPVGHGFYRLGFLTLLGCGTSIETTYVFSHDRVNGLDRAIRFNSHVTTSRFEEYRAGVAALGPDRLVITGRFKTSPRDGPPGVIEKTINLVHAESGWVETKEAGEAAGKLNHHWYSWSPWEAGPEAE